MSAPASHPGSLRVALAHHWLVGLRGGEKVLEQICQVLPGAPIYTLVAKPENLSPILRSHPIRTSWLQRLPSGPTHYKKLLPFFPSAVSFLEVEGPVDFVVSSDASVIKGLAVPEGVPHICYCHSPPRYLWDRQQDYADSSEMGGALGRAIFNRVVPRVREFDQKAAARVTHFIANSEFVRQRIHDYYGRESEVIHPPVALDEFAMVQKKPGDFDLVVSQLVPYKRIDLAVNAYNQLRRRLVIIGDGSERARLEKMAGPTVTFLGSQPQTVLRDHYQRCRALIFPGVEDFGITPLEAQASGRPVVAYRMGGALETVQENCTGLFFDEQTPECLADGVQRLDKAEMDPVGCRRNAERFSPENFRTKFSTFLEKRLPRGQRQRAFTLVELLVVMGIIAILVAVSMQAILSGIKMAKAAKCTSNMRQIGAGFQSYLSDHNNVMPQRYYPASDIGYDLLLAPYTGNNVTDKSTSIFVCPVHTACTYPLEPSYGMNWWYDNTSVMTITGLSTTIMVAETVGDDGTGSNRADPANGDIGKLDPKRHNGGSNYLFFDGHVEKLQPDFNTNYWGTDMGNHGKQMPAY